MKCISFANCLLSRAGFVEHFAGFSLSVTNMRTEGILTLLDGKTIRLHPDDKAALLASGTWRDFLARWGTDPNRATNFDVFPPLELQPEDVFFWSPFADACCPQTTARQPNGEPYPCSTDPLGLFFPSSHRVDAHTMKARWHALAERLAHVERKGVMLYSPRTIQPPDFDMEHAERLHTYISDTNRDAAALFRRHGWRVFEPQDPRCEPNEFWAHYCDEVVDKTIRDIAQTFRLFPTAKVYGSRTRSSEIPLVVVCSDEKARDAFLAQSPPGFALQPMLGAPSYASVVNGLVCDSSEEFAVLCLSDVSFPEDFAASVRACVAALDRELPAWGACGNAGVRWDGHELYRFLWDSSGGPNRSQGPRAAVGLDGNVVLLNLAALRAKNIRLPSIDTAPGDTTELSVMCLTEGLSLAVDPRLCCVRKSASASTLAPAHISAASTLAIWARTKLADFSIPTVNGPMTLGAPRAHAPLLATCHDARELGSKPGVSIVVRTRLADARHIERTFESLAVAIARAPSVTCEVLLACDSSLTELLEHGAALEQSATTLGLRFPSTRAAETRGVGAVTSALRAATHEQVWFLDAGDMVCGDALVSFARLAPLPPYLLACGDVCTDQSNQTFSGRSVLESLRDGRFPPLSSLLMPRRVLLDAIEDPSRLALVNESAFFITTAFSDMRVEVECLDTTIARLMNVPAQQESDVERWANTHSALVRRRTDQTYVHEALRPQDV